MNKATPQNATSYNTTSLDGHSSAVTKLVDGRTLKKPKKDPKRKTRMLEKVTKLFLMQGGKCYLCGNEMKLPRDFSERKVRDPLEATIDHIVPRSHGGTYRKENIKAAHRECNRRKGNTMGR